MDISRNKFSDVICGIFSAVLLWLFCLSIGVGLGVGNKVSCAIIAAVVCGIIVGLAFVLNKLIRKFSQGDAIDDDKFFVVGVVVTSLIFVILRLLIIGDVISVPMTLGSIYEQAKITETGTGFFGLATFQEIFASILSIALRVFGNTYFPIIFVQFIISCLSYVFLLIGLKNLLGKFAAFFACFGYAAAPVFLNLISSDSADGLLILNFSFAVFLISLYKKNLEENGANKAFGLLLGFVLGFLGLYSRLYMSLPAISLIILWECESEYQKEKITNTVMQAVGICVGFVVPLAVDNFVINGTGLGGFTSKLSSALSIRFIPDFDIKMLSSIVSQKWILFVLVLCVFYCVLYWKNSEDSAHLFTAFVILFTLQIIFTRVNGVVAFSDVYMICLLAIAGYGIYDLRYDGNYSRVTKLEDDMEAAVVMTIGDKVIATEEEAENIFKENHENAKFNTIFTDMKKEEPAPENKENDVLEEAYYAARTSALNSEPVLGQSDETDSTSGTTNADDSNVPFFARMQMEANEENVKNAETESSGLKPASESVFSFSSMESYENMTESGPNESSFAYEEKPAENTESSFTFEEKPAENTESSFTFEEKPAENTESSYTFEEKPVENTESSYTFEEKPVENTESSFTFEETPEVNTDSQSIMTPEVTDTLSKYTEPEERKTTDFGMNDADFESLFSGSALPPKFVRDDVYDLDEVSEEPEVVEEASEPEPVAEEQNDDSNDKKAYVDTFFSYLYDESIFDQPIEMPEHKEVEEEKGYVSNASKFADLDLDLGFDAFDNVPAEPVVNNTSDTVSADTASDVNTSDTVSADTASNINTSDSVSADTASNIITSETVSDVDTFETVSAPDLFTDNFGPVVEEAKDFAFEDPKDFAFEEPKEFVVEEPKEFAFEEPKEFIVEEPKEFAFEEPKEFAFEEPKEFIVEEPKEFAFEEPKEFVVEEPKEFSFEEPKEFIVEEPKEFTFEEPKEFIVEEPKEFAFEEPKEFVVEEPKEFSFEEPKEFVVEEPKEFSFEEPKEFVVEEPKEFVVEEPKEFSFEEPKEFSFEEPKDAVQDKVNYEDEFDFDDLKLSVQTKNSEILGWDNVEESDYTINADNKSEEVLGDEIFKALSNLDSLAGTESIEEQLEKKIDNDESFSFEESLMKKLDNEEDDEFSYEKTLQAKLDAENAIDKAVAASSFDYEETLNEKLILEEALSSSESNDISLEDVISQKVEAEDAINEINEFENFSFQEAYEKKIDAEEKIENAKIESMLEEFGSDDIFEGLNEDNNFGLGDIEPRQEEIKISEPEIVEEKKPIEFIENPLPLPKKHVHREMDYGRSIPDAWMHYDVEVDKNNNHYDI